jgi:hypothetical protein
MALMLLLVFIVLVIVALATNDVRLSKSLRIAHMALFTFVCFCEVAGFIYYGLAVVKVRNLPMVSSLLARLQHTG